MEASHFDVVIVETVGVGQSEFAVADLVDIMVYSSSFYLSLFSFIVFIHISSLFIDFIIRDNYVRLYYHRLSL